MNRYNNSGQSSLGQRLKLVIQNKNMNLTNFAKTASISYRTLQQYLTDNRIPGGEVLIKLHKHLDISIDWLLTGQGEMYKTSHTPTEPQKTSSHTSPPTSQKTVAPLQKLLTDTTEEICNRTKNLTNQQQQEILSRIKEMILSNSIEEMRREMEALKKEREQLTNVES